VCAFDPELHGTIINGIIVFCDTTAITLSRDHEVALLALTFRRMNETYLVAIGVQLFTIVARHPSR
jgi:hypothetical protein